MTLKESVALCASKSELAVYLCYQFDKTNLYELWKWFSDDGKFLSFLVEFAGSKCTVQPKKLEVAIRLYRQAAKYRQYLKHYRAKQFDLGSAVERDFLRIAGCTARTKNKHYRKIVKETRTALADVLRSGRWMARLKKLEKPKQFIEPFDLRHLDYGSGQWGKAVPKNS